MTDLLKYISESISNYLIFVFTLLLLYMITAAIINVIFNKLMVTIIATVQVIKENDDKTSEK